MKLLKKLNQKGFSHHLILPVLVMVAVASIGVYLISGSRAAELPSTSSLNVTSLGRGGVGKVSDGFLSSAALLSAKANGFHATPSGLVAAPNIVNIPPTIQQGSMGSTVVWLQLQLISLGSHNPMTGTFGPQTYSDVVTFQKSASLSQTGIVDSTTWQAIYRASDLSTMQSYVSQFGSSVVIKAAPSVTAKQQYGSIVLSSPSNISSMNTTLTSSLQPVGYCMPFALDYPTSNCSVQDNNPSHFVLDTKNVFYKGQAVQHGWNYFVVWYGTPDLSATSLENTAAHLTFVGVQVP